MTAPEIFPQTYYRFVDRWSSDGQSVVIEELRFEVARRTRAGAWLKGASKWDRDRFVLDISPKNGGRRFAYANRDQALRSFIIRKGAQIDHLQAQLERATMALKLAQSPDFEIVEKTSWGHTKRSARIAVPSKSRNILDFG